MGHKLRLLRLAFWLCNSSAAGSCIFFFKSGMWTNMRTTSLGSYPVAADLSVRCMNWWSIEVDLVVGTPPQRVSVILDTGSGAALTCRNCWILFSILSLDILYGGTRSMVAQARFVHILAPTVGIACFLVKAWRCLKSVWSTVQKNRGGHHIDPASKA